MCNVPTESQKSSNLKQAAGQLYLIVGLNCKKWPRKSCQARTQFLIESKGGVRLLLQRIFLMLDNI